MCDFERYRVLIINEFRDVSEKVEKSFYSSWNKTSELQAYLRKIAEKEFWLLGRDEDSRRNEVDKKK